MIVQTAVTLIGVNSAITLSFEDGLLIKQDSDAVLIDRNDAADFVEKLADYVRENKPIE